MPSSVKDRLTNTYEHLFHFVRSRKYYYDLDSVRVPHKSEPASFNYRVREARKGHIEIVGVKASFQEMKEYDSRGQKVQNSIDAVAYSTKFDGKSQIYNLLQNTAYARKMLGKNPDDLATIERENKSIPNRHHGSGPPDINRKRESCHLGKNPGDAFSLSAARAIELNRNRGKLRSNGSPACHYLDLPDVAKHYAEGGKNPGDVVDWRNELVRTARPLNPPKGVSLGGGNLGLRGKGQCQEDTMLYSSNAATKYKGKTQLRQDKNLGGDVGLAEFRDKCRANGAVEGHSAGKNPGDFWQIRPKPFLGAHFAVYPEALCVRPILSSCPPDGIVLDPFVGSGTTMKVALDLGRNAIGIELNPKYVEIIKRRVPTCIYVSMPLL